MLCKDTLNWQDTSPRHSELASPSSTDSTFQKAVSADLAILVLREQHRPGDSTSKCRELYRLYLVQQSQRNQRKVVSRSMKMKVRGRDLLGKQSVILGDLHCYKVIFFDTFAPLTNETLFNEGTFVMTANPLQTLCSMILACQQTRQNDQKYTWRHHCLRH